MTDLTPEQLKRVEKFKKRAKHIATQAHLDKIMETFHEEHREQLFAEIQPLLNLKDKGTT